VKERSIGIPPFWGSEQSAAAADLRLVAGSDPHAHQALRAGAEGLDPDPWLRAYLDARRVEAHLDAAGVVALGLDGRARVRAWSGRGADHAALAFAEPWPSDAPFPDDLLRALGLRSATVTVCGPRALLVAARCRHAYPDPLEPEPLIEALVSLEQGRAAASALGAAAALCATRNEGEIWRAATYALGQGFRHGPATSIAVPGSERRLDACVSGVADESALAAIADLVAIALGRGDAVPVA
jgi:hypothetical protein